MSLATFAPPALQPFSVVRNSLEDPLYEVVGGGCVEVPAMSAYAGKVASRLSFEIGLTARAERLGEAVVETLFRIPLAEDDSRNRRPDVAFVSYERWPVGKRQPTGENAWDVVPDLAVEVISPSDCFDDVVAKVAEYFRAGVRAAWVVLLVHRLVYIYDAPHSIRVISDADSLDGGTVLPGFRVELVSILDPPPAAASV